jgi:uncharacterized protein (DUF58 family)
MSAPKSQADQLLRRLEWTVIRRLDGLLQGDYRSLFRGFGLDLADLREYQFADDVRRIDWNVTARTQVTHVREYMEDREVTAWFLLDLSPSVEFGSEAASKRKALTEFTGVLARLLTRHGNRVGAVFFGGAVDGIVPARGGRRHVLHLLDALMKRPALKQAPATSLAELLRAGFDMIGRRSLVFVVSDFVSTPGWEEALNLLSRRHEVLAVRLFDPMELELPDLGLLTLQDAETGQQLFVDTRDKGFRRRFAQAAERREIELRTAFQRAGVDCLELSTTDDVGDSILGFANLRKQRARATAAPAA